MHALSWRAYVGYMSWLIGHQFYDRCHLFGGCLPADIAMPSIAMVLLLAALLGWRLSRTTSFDSCWREPFLATTSPLG